MKQNRVGDDEEPESTAPDHKTAIDKAKLESSALSIGDESRSEVHNNHWWSLVTISGESNGKFSLPIVTLAGLVLMGLGVFALFVAGSDGILSDQPQANEADSPRQQDDDSQPEGPDKSTSKTEEPDGSADQQMVHNDSITFIALETQHQLLVSGASDGSVAVRDSTTRQLLAELGPETTNGSTPIPRSAAVSDSGQLIAVSDQKETSVYSTKSWSKVASVGCGWCLVRWFDDDKILATISETGVIYWETSEEPNYRKLGPVSGQPGLNHSVGFYSDEKSFVIAVLKYSKAPESVDVLEWWRVIDGVPEPAGTILEPDLRPWNIALSPDESKIAVVAAGGGHPTKIWTTDGELVREFDTRGKSSWEVEWPTKEMLVTGGGPAIQVWDLTEADPSPFVFEHGQADDKGASSDLLSMTWDDQQKLLYSGHKHGQICAWPTSGNSISTTCLRID